MKQSMTSKIKKFNVAVLSTTWNSQIVCPVSVRRVEPKSSQYSKQGTSRAFSSAARVHARVTRGSSDHVNHKTESKPKPSRETTDGSPGEEERPFIGQKLKVRSKSIAKGHRAVQQAKSTRRERFLACQIPFQQGRDPLPAPFHDVVFICLDCEAYEHNSKKVTEVGLATLDTRELNGIPPGHNGVAWSAKIRSHHAIIAEHARYKNRFFPSCPDKFIFGETMVIKLRQAAAWTRSFFLYSTNDMAMERDIVLVGHALQNEKKYCKSFGLELEKIESLVDQFDTASMLRHDGKALLGLSRLMKGLDIKTKHMHNAGNDATYTLQALVALAVYDPEEHRQLIGRLALPKADTQGAVKPKAAKTEASTAKEPELARCLPENLT